MATGTTKLHEVDIIDELRLNNQQEVISLIVNNKDSILKTKLDLIQESYGKDLFYKFITQKNYYGKSLTELTCILDRGQMLKNLLRMGVKPQIITLSGYSLLHYAALWGSRTCLEILFENNIDLRAQTIYGETAKDIAFRNSKTEAVEFLDWAEAEYELKRINTDKKKV